MLQEARMAAQFETARLDLTSYAKQLEELAELYEKKLQDVASAAAIWRRIDELLPSTRSQSEPQAPGAAPGPHRSAGARAADRA